jgi:protein-S-isoprenylcysteine O-methyltransferase Ste14
MVDTQIYALDNQSKKSNSDRGEWPMKKEKLLLYGSIKMFCGFILLVLLLFGTAGTYYYWNAWIFLLTLAILMISMGGFLYRKNPTLLEKRLNGKEVENSQKRYVGFIGLSFILSFSLAGLDRRFEWTQLSVNVSLIGLFIMILGYAMYALVMIQNSYAARVVKVEANQAVIDTGLYAVIRHPMYTASLLLFLSMPIVLGSVVAVIPMLLFPVGLVLRIRNEEALLINELPGYSEYTKKTKYRLIPYIW